MSVFDKVKLADTIRKLQQSENEKLKKLMKK